MSSTNTTANETPPATSRPRYTSAAQFYGYVGSSSIIGHYLEKAWGIDSRSSINSGSSGVLEIDEARQSTNPSLSSSSSSSSSKNTVKACEKPITPVTGKPEVKIDVHNRHRDHRHHARLSSDSDIEISTDYVKVRKQGELEVNIVDAVHPESLDGSSSESVYKGETPPSSSSQSISPKVAAVVKELLQHTLNSDIGTATPPSRRDERRVVGANKHNTIKNSSGSTKQKQHPDSVKPPSESPANGTNKHNTVKKSSGTTKQKQNSDSVTPSSERRADGTNSRNTVQNSSNITQQKQDSGSVTPPPQRRVNGTNSHNTVQNSSSPSTEQKANPGSATTSPTKESSPPATSNSTNPHQQEDQETEETTTFANWHAYGEEAHKMIRFLSEFVTQSTKKNDDQNYEIEELRAAISTLNQQNNVLREHCTRLEETVIKAHNEIAEHRKSVARFAIDAPDSSKDDQYFSSKFTEIFLSIQEWVIQYFLRCDVTTELVDVRFSENLEKLLDRILGTKWADVLFEDHITVIEALIQRVLMDYIFGHCLLGLVGSSIDKLHGCMVDSTPKERMQWRYQTIRMICSNKNFPDRVSKRVEEVTALIDAILAPFVKAGSKGILRTRRLRSIIENAADLAIECQQQPSRFRFTLHGRGRPCSAETMMDASGRVGEKEMATREAYVGFTISPTVYRYSIQSVNSETDPEATEEVKVIILKARIVRKEGKAKRESKEKLIEDL